MIILWILLGLIGLVFLISYICFRMCFYAAPRKLRAEGEMDLPEGKIYEPYWEPMRKWAEETRQLPQEDVSITSFDGLKLTGKYYEYGPGATIELMFHGYRGSAERDLSGGVQRCRKLGRSTLLVDQRCAGKSDGNVITFGINEYRDCLAWVDFVVKKFGPDVKIILTGISMGASTVMLAGGEELPPNVVGILADCGFNSAKDIIQKVIKDMGLPPKLAWPFVKLAARIYGHFDLEANTAEEAMKRCKVPVIFFHGLDDDFVPSWMSERCYEACAARKKLVLVPGAGHGLSYPKDAPAYLDALRDFFGKESTEIA